jgi:threonine/homoserine/homoserine lactone efflux protein
VLFSVIKLLGALYLVYLGVQAWRHRKDLAAMARASGEHAAQRSRRVFREGLVVGATNPKGLLIFTAVLPQFVVPERGSTIGQFLVLGLICVTIALISDVTWGVLAGAARNWLARSARRMEAMGGAAGAIMVGLGVQLALTSQRN